jgi:hypothetical protein
MSRGRSFLFGLTIFAHKFASRAMVFIALRRRESQAWCTGRPASWRAQSDLAALRRKSAGYPFGTGLVILSGHQIQKDRAHPVSRLQGSRAHQSPSYQGNLTR